MFERREQFEDVAWNATFLQGDDPAER